MTGSMKIKERRAVVFRMYPTVVQRQQIDRTIGCARLVYNLMLETRIARYQTTWGSCRPTPKLYKDDYPFLREVDSMALCNAQLNLEKAYRNFFENPKAGFPKYKSKHRSRKTYTTNYIRNNIRFEKGGTRLRLPKIGNVRIRQHKTIPADWKIKHVTVEHTSSGRYTASVLFEYETQAPEPVTPVNAVGLDYSSHELFVSSDGEHGDYPRFYHKDEQRLAKEQRRLSRMVEGSNNWTRQKQRVARIHKHVRNQRKDYLHKTANRMTAEYDTVCVEDLNMRGISMSLKLGKSTMDNGFGMLRDMLAYKLAAQGKHMMKVGKWYPSSQLCSECGYQNTDTKNLNVREWVCPECGTYHERDENAATNIRDEGLRILLARR